MAKLAMQGRRNVPMPQSAGHNALASGDAGRTFRGATTFRPPSTHGGNVLSSILARLGIGGQPGQGEFSGGPGAPIGHPGMGGGVGADPFSRTPQAITGGTPIAPNDPTMPGVGAPAMPAQAQGTPPPGYGDSTFTPPATPGGLPQLNEGRLPSLVQDAGSNGLVDLGNGMFYNPATDQVTHGGAAPNAATGARGLYRE
jgi:hypothetical protein